jgi:hypothetical protein
MKSLSTIITELRSELFSKLVYQRRLRHPTARNFEPEAWKIAWKDLKNPTDHDGQLLVAALCYGHEVATLRETLEPQLYQGLNRRTAKIVTFATANQQYRLIQQKAKQEAQKYRKGGIARIDRLPSVKISLAYESNRVSPDAAVTAIVDTLPHCLERTNKLPDKAAAKNADLEEISAKLFTVLSVEHGLRDLWQQILWDGWQLILEKEKRQHCPTNRTLAGLWLAWVQREEALGGQRHLLETIKDEMILSQHESLLQRTVIGIGGHKGNSRFQYGDQAATVAGQAQHLRESAALEDSYLKDFIDVHLPTLDRHGLTGRDLHKAWCIIRDAAKVLATKIQAKRFTELADLEQYALVVRKSELERALVECNSLLPECASEIINCFSLDTNDVAAMFDEGFWSRPLLSIDDEMFAIVIPSLEAGNPIRRMEHWLIRSGLSDHLSKARRGLTYEEFVRKGLSAAIEANKMFSKSSCYPHAISESAGEEIDLLIRLNNTVIVGEIKCLVRPAEPIERFNYLTRLTDAGAQADRKANWIRSKSEVVAAAFKISNEEARHLTITPLVVMNQNFGCLLDAAGVQIVDYRFLNLYLSSKSYVAEAAFRKDDRTMGMQTEMLYRSELEAEANFTKAMARPAPLKRYVDAIEWNEWAFPMSDGKNLTISVCQIGEKIGPSEAGDILDLLDG